MARTLKDMSNDDTEIALNELPKMESPDDIAIDNLMSEFMATQEAEVKVHRVLPTNKLSYLYACHPSEFKFDDLRDKFKGGKFRVFVTSINDMGKRQLVSTQQVEVEKPDELPPQLIQQNNSDIAGLAQVMVQGFQQLGELIAKSNQKPAFDPDEAENKFMQRMVIMKQLFSSNEPRQENSDLLGKSLEMLTKGIEMGKSLTPAPLGESSTTDVLLETVKSLAPAFMASIQQNQQAPNTQPIRQPLPPAILQVPIADNLNVQNNPTINTQLESETDMNFIQRAKLKAGLSFLVDAAKRGLDVYTYANITLDSLTDEELGQIFATENPIETLSQIEPEINNHKLWFEMLFNALKESLTFDDETSNNQETDINEIKDALSQYKTENDTSSQEI